MSERIVAVFGATGTQGGSVVDALLVDGTFKPRAITRDISTRAAKTLKERGCEVAQADLLDYESLKRATSGCECVFGVTPDYVDHRILEGTDIEAQMGKSLVDAAKENNVKFFVWSSTPSSSELSEGKYAHLFHLDNKAAVEAYLKCSGLPNASVQTGFFLESIWKHHTLRKADIGYELIMPILKHDTPVYFSWIARDLGSSVLAILKNYHSHQAKVNGQTFHAMCAKSTFGNFAKILESAFGIQVRYVEAPRSGIVEFDDSLDMTVEVPWDIDVPDPRLRDLGVKFGTLREFAGVVRPKYV